MQYTQLKYTTSGIQFLQKEKAVREGNSFIRREYFFIKHITHQERQQSKDQTHHACI